MMSGGTNKKSLGKIPNTGTLVGAGFAAWTIVFTLADYYLISRRPHLIWVTITGFFGAALASFMFVWLSQIARDRVGRHQEQVEEGGFCPWAYFGGLGIIVALILMGLGVEYLAYSFMLRSPFPPWEVVLLGANAGIVSLAWWTHLVIGERQPPKEVPRHSPEKDIFLEALKMETEFLRVIIGALTQFIYLAGTGIIGVIAFFLSGNRDIEDYGYLILTGLGVWILGLHLAMTSPFMRRHGAIIRAMLVQARVEGSDDTAPRI